MIYFEQTIELFLCSGIGMLGCDSGSQWTDAVTYVSQPHIDATHDARLLLREGLHLHDQASVDVISQELLGKLGIHCKVCILSLCQKPLPAPPDYSTLEVSSDDRSVVNVNRLYTGGLRRTSTTSACVEDTCVTFGKFTRRKWSCHAHVCEFCVRMFCA